MVNVKSLEFPAISSTAAELAAVNAKPSPSAFKPSEVPSVIVNLAFPFDHAGADDGLVPKIAVLAAI